MAEEIERKFLVRGDEWKSLAEGVPFRQGYLSTARERTVRVRTMGNRAAMTVKGITRGFSRLEFEYAIPLADAHRMLDELCERPLIEKTRYTIVDGAARWEVDEFDGANRGLVLAEIELATADQAFLRPAWIGEEVSNDPRFFNSNLVQHPFSEWGWR